MTILRLVLALLVGVIVFATTVAGIEWIGHQSYPVPESITDLQAAITTAMSDGRLDDAGRLGEELKAELGIYAETAPTGALLFVVFAWIAGAFLGGGIAAAITPFLRVPMAMVIALLDVAGIVVMTSQIPHPTWMPIAGVGGSLVAGLLAGMLVSAMRGPKRPAPKPKAD
jgi:hypothetical protein